MDTDVFMPQTIEGPVTPATAPAGGGSTRVFRIAVASAIGYAAVLSVLAWAGIYFFVLKSLIVPLICLAAILARGGRTFVRDWAVFLSVVVLFDAVRGLIYGVTLAWHLPVHFHYVITMEETLFGTIVPLALQHAWRAPWLDHAAVLVHASHFVFFLAFGFFVWMSDRDAFHKWSRAFTWLLGLGLLGYLLVPTAPPWLASSPRFALIPPVLHIAGGVYNHVVPSLTVALDINPVAAMPSLHIALPAFCALVAWELGGARAGLPISTYVVAVAFAVMYLGEHYAADVLMGALLAAAVFLAHYRRHLFAARVAPVRPLVVNRVYVAAAVLLLVATVAGAWTEQLLQQAIRR